MLLDYNANNTFAQVHQDPSRYLFIRGPVGSGKSSGCIWHILLNALQQPVQYDGVRRSRYGILRATYPALKTTVVKSWQLWFKNLIKVVYDTPIRGEIKMPHPDGKTTMHIELVFIALDREEDVNKLQSLELTGAHLNEAAEIPQAIHQMLKSRVNRYPDEASGYGAVDPFIIADHNSVPTDHWLYKIAEETKPKKHGFYAQPPALLMVEPGTSDIVDADGNCYVVNPDADNLGHFVPGNKWTPPRKNAIWHDDIKQWFIPHLSPDYYIDMVSGAESDWVSVMVLNNYGELRSGKPVYPQYIDMIHYKENLTPIVGVPIIIGMDLGLTPAAAFMQLTPRGDLIIFDEIVTEDCSIQEFCDDYLKPHLHNNYSKFSYELIIDPAATIRSQNDKRAAGEVIKDCGLSFRTARTNNPISKREAVVSFLRKQSGLAVGPKVPYIRKGFISEFKFEKKRFAVMNVRSSNADLFKDKWEKNIYSHIHEGVQYGALECTGGRTGKKRGRARTATHTQPVDSAAGY